MKFSNRAENCDANKEKKFFVIVILKYLISFSTMDFSYYIFVEVDYQKEDNLCNVL